MNEPEQSNTAAPGAAAASSPYRAQGQDAAGPGAPCSLSDIRAFRQLGEHFGTAGQPTEQQLRRVGAAGYAAVINLALPTSDHALANEGGIVTALGMAYAHLPVHFDAPADEDFRRFCGVLGAFEGQRVFIHCAANMRVSAFMYLYRVRLGLAAREEAERDLRAIWTPDEVWQAFIERQLTADTGTAGGNPRPAGPT